MKYFQLESTKLSEVTKPFPIAINIAPMRTRVISFPHRDMTIPAMRPPIGVANDGIASLAPAVVAESRSTI